MKHPFIIAVFNQIPMSTTPIVVLSVATMVAILVGISVAPAGAQTFPSLPPGMPSFTMVSGTYSNTEKGVEIVFPDGWEGTEITSNNTLIVSVMKGGLQGSTGDQMPPVMTLIVTEKSDSEGRPTAESAAPDSKTECHEVSTSNVQAAGVTAIQSVAECNAEGRTLKAKTTIIEQEENWVMLSMMAETGEYESNVGQYDTSLNTLQVDEAVNAESVAGEVKDVAEETTNSTEVTMTSTVESVMIGGASVNVELKSSSTISEFKVNEESKTISFKAEGESGTQGKTEIKINKVLEGPYTVTIDGKATSDFSVSEDPATGETTMTLTYTHSSHDVVITGTNVVPEFPIGVIGAVAAVIGIIAIMTRTKFASGLLHK
jgi:hypothetical protein